MDHETTIDSIDFYLYVLKLESMVDGNMYIYIHHPGQLIRNKRCTKARKSIYYNVIVCSTKDKLNKVTSYLAFKNAYGVNEIIKKYLPPCHKMKVSAVSNKDQYKKDDVLKITFRFR